MIKVLVCDDDEFITQKISALLQRVKNDHNVCFDVDIRNCSDFIKDSNIAYDIAVVDIEMPDVNGLELTQKLREINPDIIVLVITSFADYLDCAMRVSVFRYISKPIDEDRFTRNFLEAVDASKQISKTVVVEKADGVYVLKTKDILYIENLKHGSLIVTKNQRFKTNQNLSYWFELIDRPDCFVYSHKSYLINLQNIINFDQHTVTFQSDGGALKVACVAQRRYTELKKDFFGFVGGN